MRKSTRPLRTLTVEELSDVDGAGVKSFVIGAVVGATVAVGTIGVTGQVPTFNVDFGIVTVGKR